MRASEKSKMWITHYVVGLGFYVTIGMAIWVDSASTPTSSSHPTTPHVPIPALVVFMISSICQHIAHKHLSSLKKYSLPGTDPALISSLLFKYTLTPHYFCEVMIYLSLAFIGGSTSDGFGLGGNVIVNQTLLIATIFVAVNLGVSAGNTYVWYVDKFGREMVGGRWKMVPGIY